MSYQKKQLSILCVFITIELVLGILVQTTSNNLNTIVSFSSVVLAFLYSLLLIKKNKDTFLTSVGLFTTVCADIFLVVMNPRIQLPAMFFFSVTQICYFLRLYFNEDSKTRKIHLIVRIIVTLVSLGITTLVLKDKTDLLSLISLFYYANLIINIVFSFTGHEKSIIFSIGLILFACCDLLIGFNIMSSAYIELSPGTFFYFLAHPGFNLAWVFYVPSQVLIALSNTSLKEKALI